MALTFALELLCLFSFPKERNGFSFFGHRCRPDQPPLAPGVPKQVIWCVFYHLSPLRHISYVFFERPSLICLSVGFLSLI